MFDRPPDVLELAANVEFRIANFVGGGGVGNVLFRRTVPAHSETGIFQIKVLTIPDLPGLALRLCHQFVRDAGYIKSGDHGKGAFQKDDDEPIVKLLTVNNFDDHSNITEYINQKNNKKLLSYKAGEYIRSSPREIDPNSLIFIGL